MKIAIYTKEGYLLFSNEDIQVGDPVFHLAHFYCPDGKNVYITDIRKDLCPAVTGWPDNPAIVEDLHYNKKDKIEEVRTSHGYSPKVGCFKYMGMRK